MSTETYEYEKINAKDKPIAEDFVYVYSEIEDGGFRKVSKAMLKVLLGVATKADLMTARVSGTEIICTDGADAPLGDFNLYGRCEQNGEQTPQNPIEIVNVGKYNEETGKYEVEIKTTGKNLITYPFYDTSKSISDITFTDNGDGTITANGTSSAEAVFYCNYSTSVITLTENEKYTFGGCPNGGSINGYRVELIAYDGKWKFGYGSTLGNPKTITALADDTKALTVFMRIVIAKGVTVSNLTFKPMLIRGTTVNDEFEPYKERTVTIELDEPLRAIPVLSNGNYTDKNGQQWICDTLERDSNGSYKIIRRIEERIFNGSDSAHNCDYVNPSVNNGTEILVQINLGSATEMRHVLYVKSNYIMCDKFAPFDFDTILPFVYGARMGSSGAICIMLPTSEGVTDIASANEWLSENPVTVHYLIKTPITETLPPSEIAKLKSLQTFNPTTIITADGGEIEVMYAKENDVWKYILQNFIPRAEGDALRESIPT